MLFQLGKIRANLSSLFPEIIRTFATYVQIRNLQRPVQGQPAAGASRGAHAVRPDPDAVRRQPHGRPLRRRRPHAAGRRVVRRRGLLHPLRHRNGADAGADPARGRAVRAGRQARCGGLSQKRHDLLLRAGFSDCRRAAGRHSAHVSHGTARRGGRPGDSLLQAHGFQYAGRHALLRVQAVSRRGGQHRRVDGDRRRMQPDERRAELGLHLRTLRFRSDGSDGCGRGDAHFAHRHAARRHLVFLPPQASARVCRAAARSALLAPLGAAAGAHGRADFGTDVPRSVGLRADEHHDGGGSTPWPSAPTRSR